MPAGGNCAIWHMALALIVLALVASASSSSPPCVGTSEDGGTSGSWFLHATSQLDHPAGQLAAAALNVAATFYACLSAQQRRRLCAAFHLAVS
mmetsp:Transcript_27664/g.62606  ORF Transcript_27664/g.62606 Transcript_27664/m.62606 type:complete len:93 (+) Transcript_27664:96-374(+)